MIVRVKKAVASNDFLSALSIFQVRFIFRDRFFLFGGKLFLFESPTMPECITETRYLADKAARP